MANKMLIDAMHPEETRVVVVRGNRVEEFDFESANRKQLRGNIYLAKITRVEPSLQAAFVDYGGNRHGFLAFSEIHPAYYQIPVADRQALLAEESRAEDDEDEDRSERRRGKDRRERRGRRDEVATAEVKDDAEAEAPEAEASSAADGDDGSSGGVREVGSEEDEQVESVGAGEDALEEVPERSSSYRSRRTYKIQEVIKRRQIMVVQVVKEERGNKGAALTTYLSLAGRYSVLMPNTARGGGISRKITSAADRKKLKEIAGDLEVPEGMGVILRTAGANRTKAEIKRDFEYLLRLWETVREHTLNSIAPALVYEEGSLIKRAIRDLYNKDIDEVLVAGEEGYREAKDFMRMLMPSHAKNVQPYREREPIFAKSGVEAQLDAMFNSQVTLRSGGYIVINQTEALVSIDVNSGRATREHNIEDTALKTNLEAAEEVSRQLRLRDLAGLIVIDFIDMEEKRNNRAVERKLKDCLKNDRARIQVGRISHFGLLEMSRQRIRTGVLESSSEICPHCAGAGIVRSVPSVALHVLRLAEDHLLRQGNHHLNIRTRTAVALYVLNQKRAHLNELEERFGVSIMLTADDTLTGTNHCVIERGEAVEQPVRRVTSVRVDTIAPEEPEEVVEEEDEDEAEEEAAEAQLQQPRQEARRQEGERGPHQQQPRGEGAEGEGGRRRRRRRRRRRGGGRPEDGVAATAQAGAEVGAEFADGGFEDADEGDEADEADEAVTIAAQEAQPAEAAVTDAVVTEAVADAPAVEAPAVEAPAEEAPAKPKRSRSRKAAAAAEAEPAPKPARASRSRKAETATAAAEAEAPAKPKRSRSRKAAAAEERAPATAAELPEAAVPPAPLPEPEPVAEEPAPPAPAPEPIKVESAGDAERPRRTGWWARKLLGG